MNKFSYFNPPINNITPNKVVDIEDCFRMISNDDLKVITNNYRINGCDKQTKLNVFPTVTFSGLFKKINKENLIKYTGLFVLDLDSIQNPDHLKKSLSNDPLLDFLIIFTSPSNQGLKLILAFENSVEEHEEIFNYLKSYLIYKYGLSLDESGKDVTRRCFLCHDPEAYFNINAKVNNKKTFLKEFKDLIKCEKADQVLGLVRNKILTSIDGQKHKELVKVSYLLGGYVSGSIIEYSKAYNHLREAILDRGNLKSERDALKTISKCLSKGMGKKISIDDLFNSILNNNYSRHHEIDSIDIEIDDVMEYTFSQDIYDRLPDNLNIFLSQFPEGIERDTVFLTTLTTIGQAFSNYYFTYDSSNTYLILMCYVIGYAGSGKGNSKWGIQLAKKIEHHLKKLNPDSKFLVPGNISKTALLTSLSNNKGSLLMAETETDSVSNANRQEWGSFSDTFRKSFHHEPESFERIDDKKKKTNEIKVDELRLGLNLSSTPNQIIRLIPNHNDGLASRMIYYIIYENVKWKNKLSSDVNQRTMKNLDNEVISRIPSSKTEIIIPNELHDIYNRKLEDLFDYYSSKHPLVAEAFVQRMGVIALRIASILTVLKNEPNTSEMRIQEKELLVALDSIEILLYHSFDVIGLIKDKYIMKLMPAKQRIVFDQIGAEPISMTDAVNLGERNGISRPTVSRLLNNDKLFKRNPDNTYSKVK